MPLPPVLGRTGPLGAEQMVIGLAPAHSPQTSPSPRYREEEFFDLFRAKVPGHLIPSDIRLWSSSILVMIDSSGSVVQIPRSCVPPRRTPSRRGNTQLEPEMYI